ncbi:response regulator [Synechococcus sp. PCC 6312]|uniref:response regulator n=1 Tax=Synechococcus sp. (strain ATCC 27167 / PCC 6312) TaxID=195253 RepID=UPI00029F3AA4|nr:response regulator [Synechococcus sp. PCC 6312]AFY61264.1 response regulator containing a CheY-like receiver domain and a GGDEF domain [Synechococcus sp. PCC 6312]
MSPASLIAKPIPQNQVAAPLIACIDDSRTVQRQISLTLTAAGYKVLPIMSPTQAKAQLLATPPALILLDIVMPEVDGYELCRQIHRTPALAEIPILMLTAVDHPIFRIRARGVGAEDFLCKPIAPDTLLAHLEKLLHLGQFPTRRPPMRQNFAIPSPTPTLDPKPYWDLASQRLGLSNRQRQTLITTGQKLERALMNQPQRADLWEKLGMVSYLLNHLTLAVLSLNNALKLMPENHYHHRNLGWLAEELREIESAIQHYQAWLGVVPDDVYVQGRLKLIQESVQA